MQPLHSLPQSQKHVGGALYLDEFDDDWGWVYPTDLVVGLVLLRKQGVMEDDSKFVLEVSENRCYDHSGLVAVHSKTLTPDYDYRRLASVIISNDRNAVQYADSLLRALAISRHGVLYRVGGHRAGQLRLDRVVSQVQQRYVKLKKGGLAWSRELQTLSGVPVLVPIISLNKISPWRRLVSTSQCEDGSSRFQPFVLFLLIFHLVNPGAIQFRPTSISCAWPKFDSTLADEDRNLVVADSTMTSTTSTILMCHNEHKQTSDQLFHVNYAGLWRGIEFDFGEKGGRLGTIIVPGVSDLNRKDAAHEPSQNIKNVYNLWKDVAEVKRLEQVDATFQKMRQIPEENLRQIRSFYTNFWEPLSGIRLELSDDEVILDLAICLTVVMETCAIQNLNGILELFLETISQEWVPVAKESRVFPSRMAAPLTPCVLLNKDRNTYYTFGSSFSWIEKKQVERKGSQIIIPGELSRVYKDGLVVGDLDGMVWNLTRGELSLIENGTIGWITEFVTDEMTYSVVEVDVLCARMFEPDKEFRAIVASKTQQTEPRISNVHPDDFQWVRKCLPIAAVLLAAQKYISLSQNSVQISSRVSLKPYNIVVTEITNELCSDKLCSIDLAYFHTAMGSYGSRNKIWSAKILAEHKRIWSLLHNPKKPEIVEWLEGNVKGRVLYSDHESVYVQARRPWDTVIILASVIAGASLLLIEATRQRDFYDLGTLFTAAIGTVTGVTGIYHAIRYRGWALGDAIRAYRKCRTVEEMRAVMHKEEVHKTLLDAGENGRFMDGVRTCAYSDHNVGTFAVSKGLHVDMFEKCGGKLGIDSEGDDVIMYGNRMRKVEMNENNLAHVTQTRGVFPIVAATRLKNYTME